MRSLPEPVRMPAGLKEKYGLPPLVARLLARRGLVDDSAIRVFLDPAYYRPTSPLQLPNVERAIELLTQARTMGKRVCVWGDFDVDGQTATALLVEGLEGLGFDVSHHIPDRMDGHGLNSAGLRRIAGEGIELVVTCDCGIGDAEVIDGARIEGLELIVTDHHELPKRLPDVGAVIDPRVLPGGHPLEHLCGVGVAYALLRALCEGLGESERVERGLDLVALGTVADMGVLKGENRYLVQKGFRRLQQVARPGIDILLRTAGVSPPDILDVDLIGFTLAPRLSAVGRLDAATKGVELLLSGERERCLQLAAEMEILNDRRIGLCEQLEHQAAAMATGEEEAPALVLARKEWHPGIVGIVAGRLAECYRRPAVLIGGDAQGEGKGSIRSSGEVDILQILALHGDLLLKWGGHRRAAGFTIVWEEIAAFKRAFLQAVEEMTIGSVADETRVEEWIDLGELAPEQVRQIYALAPFGPGNEKPILGCREVSLKNAMAMGAGGRHTRLLVEDGGGNCVRGIWWNRGTERMPQGEVDLAFRPGFDSYRGRMEVQVELVDAEEQEKAEEEKKKKLPFSVIDRREEQDRVTLLRQLEEVAQIQIWAEGGKVDAPESGRKRHELETGGDLVIWTAPPGPQVLRQVLERVNPGCVHLANGGTNGMNPTEFLRRLGGLLKSVIARQQGGIRLVELAGLTAQREATVLAGLDYLEAAGRIAYRESAGRILVELGGGNRRETRRAEDLKRLLQETAAYRRYFSRGKPEDLLQVRG